MSTRIKRAAAAMERHISRLPQDDACALAGLVAFALTAEDVLGPKRTAAMWSGIDSARAAQAPVGDPGVDRNLN